MYRSAAVRVSVLASFALCIAITSTAASAGQTQETKIDDAKIDPRAEAIFRQFAETVAGLKNYRVDLDFSMTNQSGEVRVKLNSKYQVTLQPPNKFILAPGDEANGMRFTSDGTHQFVYSPRTSTYTNSAAPANLNLLAVAVIENYGPLRDPAPMMFATYM